MDKIEPNIASTKDKRMRNLKDFNSLIKRRIAPLKSFALEGNPPLLFMF